MNKLLFILSILSIQAQPLIDPDRTYPWSQETCGVTTNWPSYRTTIFTNVVSAGIDNTGNSDISITFRTLLSSSQPSITNPLVFYFPDGIYSIRAPMNLNQMDYYTIRFSSNAWFRDDYTNGSAYGMINFGRGDSVKPYVNILSGSTNLSTNITVSTGSTFHVGDFVHMEQSNITNLSIHNGSVSNLIRWGPKITAMSSPTNITFWPPLDFDFINSPVARPITTVYEKIALENVKFTHTNRFGTLSQNGSVFVGQCNELYMSNVFSFKSGGFHVIMIDCLRPQFTQCTFSEAQHYGPNNAGIIGYDSIFCALVENSIFDRCFPGIELNQGCAGNVVTYSFFTNSLTGSTFSGYDVDFNHSPHCMKNLAEGNVACNVGFSLDNYFGSASHNTALRNWFTVQPTAPDLARGVDLGSRSISNNIVGNIIGHAGMTGLYTTTNNNYNSSTALIYRFGYPIPGQGAYSGTRPTNNFGNSVALDLNSGDMATSPGTTMVHGNYDYITGTQIWNSGITNHVIPMDLFYTSKPAFLGISPYPTFEPGSLTYNNTLNLPAVQRYYSQIPTTATTNNFLLIIAPNIKIEGNIIMTK